MSRTDIQGTVARGFEPVRDVFRDNFTLRREIGAACAVYLRGEKVVDLWGGSRDEATGEPWEKDTLVLVFSTTKGMAATAVAVAHARGLFDYDDPVAKYWPEFAQQGKGAITIRALLCHQAGLLNPRSLTARAFNNPRLTNPADLDTPAFRAVEMPASNGVGTARAVARVYSSLALGGSELGIDARTLRALVEPATPPRSGQRDLVLGVDSSFSLGFLKPCDACRFGSSETAFGTPGAGGSFGFADPDIGLGFAYVMNRMGFYIADDPREKALRDATYRCAARAASLHLG